MKPTTTAKAKGQSITFNDGTKLIDLLRRTGYNTKTLANDDFLDLHYLKLKLSKALDAVNESMVELAKEMKHEIVLVSQNDAQFRLVKSEKDGQKEYANATPEFLEKKVLIEKQPIEGLKLNFMTIDAFREWAGNMDHQFELTEFLLKEK